MPREIRNIGDLQPDNGHLFVMTGNNSFVADLGEKIDEYNTWATIVTGPRKGEIIGLSTSTKASLPQSKDYCPKNK